MCVLRLERTRNARRLDSVIVFIHLSDTIDHGRACAPFAASIAASQTLFPNYTLFNSVLNGIHPFPNQTTGGEGPVAGNEVQLTMAFNPPLTLDAGHYFFVPQVHLVADSFLWSSAARPITAPGIPFTNDLQSSIRDASLSPDWLRVGTDIVGGAPTFNHVFELTGVDDTLFRNGFD